MLDRLIGQFDEPGTQIVIDHAYAYLVPDSKNESDVIEAVDAVTSWKDPGDYFAQRFSGRRFDTTHRLLSKKKLQFPTGLVPTVAQALEESGYSYQLHDNRTYPETVEEIRPLTDIELRGYQTEAVLEGLKSKRGVFSLPPGLGKTEIMIALVNSLRAFPTLWLTHTRTLLEQTFERFKQRLEHQGISIGQIGGGSWQPKDITIATVQTLTHKANHKKVIELLKPIQVIISDEAHHTPSKTWFKLLCGCSAPFRFGCSATPLDRGDGSDLCLIGTAGDIIYELTPMEAAELGFIDVPKITFVEYMDGCNSAKEPYAGEVIWKELYEKHIVNASLRNQAILDVCKHCVESDRRAIVLIRMIEHGKILEKELIRWFQTDAHVKFVWGTSSDAVRHEVVEAFKDGVVRVLIASSIFDEGADIPEIDAVVIAAAGKSAIKAMQRAGRGMRKSSEKQLLVFDFMDRAHPVLLKHSNARRRVYRNRGFKDITTGRLGE